MTREQELAAAVEQAAIPPRDYRIFCALLNQRAEWKTANIPTKFQPRGLAELARMAQMSKPVLCRGLADLEQHGWVTRKRATGQRTVYQLAIGVGYGFRVARPEPKSDADRARRYRQKKKWRAECDELGRQTERNLSQIPVTQETEPVSESRDDLSQIVVTTCLASRDETAGQGQFYAKEGRNEGKSEREGLCTVCRTSLHPVLIREGYQTHPCCDPAEEAPGWPAATAGDIAATFGIRATA